MVNVAVLGNWGTAKEMLEIFFHHETVSIQFVITQYDQNKFDDRWHNIVYNFAQENNLAVYEQSMFKSNDSALLELLETYGVDLVVSCAYPYLLKVPVIEYMNERDGIINFHGSLLPRHRGVSPVVWAVMKDDKHIGMTLHYIDSGCDSGDIIMQRSVENNYVDSIDVITEKLKNEAKILAKKYLDYHKKSNIPRTIQDHKNATYAPRLKRANLCFDFNEPVEKVMAFFRACSNLEPYITIKETECIVSDLKILQDKSANTRTSKIVDFNEKQQTLIATTKTAVMLLYLRDKLDMKLVKRGILVNA